MRHLVWVLFVFVKLTQEDWVEIAQSGDEQKSHELGGLFSDVLGGEQFKTITANSTSRPNQAWLDYQIERFGLKVKPTRQSPVISNTNKLIVNDRIGHPNNDQSTTHQFTVPLRVTDRFPQDPETYETVVKINSRPQTTIKATAILNHKNKIKVTSANESPEEPDLQPEASEDQEKTTDSTPSEDPNATSLTALQKIINFMKSFHQNFITKTSMGIKKKVEYLHRLKDHLLIEIEERLSAIFASEGVQAAEKDDEVSPRVKRGLLFEDSGITFPSAEGALMTINFLTFAVFLIKLVLQVIRTVKSKHYKYSALNVNTMGAMKFDGRKTRSIHHNTKDPNLWLLQGDIDVERVLKLFYN